jgi:hypothetical protein
MKQIMGTALRPQMPEKISEHESVAPSESEQQQSVLIDDENEDEVRVHTVSFEAYYRDDESTE